MLASQGWPFGIVYSLGELEWTFVGDSDGRSEGLFDGMDVGKNDGDWEAVGPKEGNDEGNADGLLLGNAEGYVDVTVDGTCVGIFDGMTLG